MEKISFSLPEILALLGMVQCTYLIVHVSLRSRQVSHAALPLLYFFVLGLAFMSDFAQGRLLLDEHKYFYVQWFLWFSGAPLSVLLVLQLADMNKTPALRDYWVLLLLPLSFTLSLLATNATFDCEITSRCEALVDMLKVTGLMAGTISLLVIFSKKDLLKQLPRQKFGKERYWLIFFLIILNACFLFVVLMSLSGHVSESEGVLLRNILGIGFVYIVSTTLLRIIPRGQKSAIARSNVIETLSADEKGVATKIDSLMSLEKVYQEPTYSRADMAKECDTSETIISRVINLYFQQSFPQLLNEHRVKDAQQLLEETDANMQVIYKEVGFNSLPSFNRVFKDVAGVSPSEYRKKANQK